jgi:CPA2 family monovalent cation:H+ antiporter-2
MSLAQIGEFSFIIATLGLSLGVTSDFLYPIAVSASAVTTFTTPYLIRLSGPAAEAAERRLPPWLREMLAHYHATMNRDTVRRLPALLWQAYGGKVFLNGVIVVAIGLGVKKAVAPVLERALGGSGWAPAAPALLALVAASPFLWAIVFGSAKTARDLGEEEARSLQGARFGVATVRALAGAASAAFVLAQFGLGTVTTLTVLLGFALLLLLWNKRAKGVYSAVEDQFLHHLRAPGHEPPKTRLAPWDAALSEVVLAPHSELVSRSLQDSKLKERFGVTIGMIERGRRRILAPGRGEVLLPYDRLFLIGTDEQISAVRPVMETDTDEAPAELPDSFGLEPVTLPPGSPFAGKTIRDAGIREKVHGLIVGIERDGQRILNPDSALDLRAGDLVWLVGDKARIRELR